MAGAEHFRAADHINNIPVAMDPEFDASGNLIAGPLPVVVVDGAPTGGIPPVTTDPRDPNADLESLTRGMLAATQKNTEVLAGLLNELYRIRLINAEGFDERANLDAITAPSLTPQ